MVTLKRAARVVALLLLGFLARCTSSAELERLAKHAAVGARQVGCSDAVGRLLDAGAASAADGSVYDGE